MDATPNFEICEKARQTIDAALNGFHSPGELSRIRTQLAECQQCLQVFDFEVRVRVAMSTRGHDQAPQSLQIRISEALQRVELGDLDITDF